MEYLITPSEETDWKINPSDFVDNLLKQWPDSQIKKITDTDDYYSIEWVAILHRKGQRLDGALHRDKQGISLDGYLEDCAEFATWFRSQVPLTQRLVFYDRGYNSCIELQQETTESEIMTAFVASAIMI